MSIKKTGMSLMKMAIIFIVTILTKIKFGNIGYFSLGYLAIMLLSSDITLAYSFIFAGIPSASADIALGYSYNSLYTFIISGLLALALCYIKQIKKEKSVYPFLALLLVFISRLLIDTLQYGVSILTISVKIHLLTMVVTAILYWIYIFKFSGRD